jgi:type III restriction enzyme
MPDTLLENPILNAPYREPNRHFRFGDEGITNEIVDTRRASAYFVPIPPPKKKGKIAVKVINHHGDEVLKVYKV